MRNAPSFGYIFGQFLHNSTCYNFIWCHKLLNHEPFDLWLLLQYMLQYRYLGSMLIVSHDINWIQICANTSHSHVAVARERVEIAYPGYRCQECMYGASRQTIESPHPTDASLAIQLHLEMDGWPWRKIALNGTKWFYLHSCKTRPAAEHYHVHACLCMWCIHSESVHLQCCALLTLLVWVTASTKSDGSVIGIGNRTRRIGTGHQPVHQYCWSCSLWDVSHCRPPNDACATEATTTKTNTHKR